MTKGNGGFMGNAGGYSLPGDCIDNVEQNATLYAVDEIDDKHNSRLAVTETTLTAARADEIALELWSQGKHVQILAWTAEDGYTVTGNFN